MKEHDSKKAWVTPRLTVLVRSRPEEAVLLSCKYPSTHTGPDNPNCKIPQGQGGGGDCSVLFNS